MAGLVPISILYYSDSGLFQNLAAVQRAGAGPKHYELFSEEGKVEKAKNTIYMIFTL